MKAKILLLLLGGLGLLSQKATGQSLTPSVLAAVGGTATTGPVEVAWTLGEPIIQTSGTVTQGFHSAGTPVLSGTESVARGGLLQVFPNPVARMLTLRFKGAQLRTAVQVVVWNALAQPVITATLAPEVDDFSLDCSSLAPGAYWLALRDEHGATLEAVPFLKK